MDNFPPETHEAIKEYILKKEWDFSVYRSRKRIELKIKICPFCGNSSGNFEINAENGLFRCWACDRTGSFASLQMHMGDDQDGIVRIQTSRTEKAKTYKTIPIERLLPAEDNLWKGQYGILEYLQTQRALTEETLKYFHIGAALAPGGGQAVVIPHIRNNVVALLMYRMIDPNSTHKYLREEGMQSVFFNEEALFMSGKEIIVCEGQIDAMSVWQAGLKNVISISTGASTEWPNEWIDLLSGFQKIIMVYDGDSAGKHGARNIRHRLGDDRVWIAEMPEERDANDILAKDGDEALVRIVSTARPAPIPGMISIADGISLLQDEQIEGKEHNREFPWFSNALNNSIGTPEEGDLVEIMGAPGTGKTTLMLQQSKFLSLDLSIPTLITCLEMPVAKLTRKLIQCEFTIPKDEVSLEIIGEAMVHFENTPLYFAYPPQNVTIDECVRQATSAFKRFGVRAWILDNLIILTEGAENALREQARVTRALKDWARTNETIVYLLAHPRKVESGKLEGIGDMRGNGAISANADILINIHRRSLAPTNEGDLYSWNQDVQSGSLLDPLTAFYTPKSRDSESKIGWMYFYGEWSYFRDAVSDDFVEAQKRAQALSKD